MTLPAGFRTIADIVREKMNNEALFGLVDETLKATPSVSGQTMVAGQWKPLPGVGMAMPIPGLDYKTLVRKTLPTVAFTEVNEGQDYTKGARERVKTQCYPFNPRWGVGKLAAQEDDRGWEVLMAEAAGDHITALWQQIEKCFFYGTNSTYGDAKAFPGLLQSYDATNMVINVGGTGTALSSAWLVAFGPSTVHWVWGRDAQMTLADVREQDVTADNSKPMSSYVQEISGWVGLRVASQQHIVRIKNISAAKPLTSTHVSAALALLPTGVWPNAIFMTPRTADGYHGTLLPVNETGKPAPIPQSIQEVPIARTDLLSNAETTAI